MALFEFFPNYIWNLSIAIALESGGRIGEIVDMCAPIRETTNQGGDVGEDFLDKARGMTLEGVMERITVPFLITHGAADRQISVEYAHKSYEQLINARSRDLKIFTPQEGGVEHVGADNMSFGRDYIADWFAEQLGGRVS